MKIAIFGAGWIGNQFIHILEASTHEYIIVPKDIRADDPIAVGKFLDAEQPTHVASFIGRTHGGGINTIDYLEQPGKLVDNVRDNLFAPISIGLLCAERNIHCTSIGTGCIFTADDPTQSSYDEDALPDFFGSGYSTVKGFTDRLLHTPYLAKHVLNVRIRMPIVDFVHSRNFITKITQYERICSIPNSMTVLPELLPLVLDMMINGRTGTINLTNPGVISHDKILTMYREIVNPDFTWKNMTLEEQNAILLSKRSNNQLDTSKLLEWYPNVTPIVDAVRRCLSTMKSL
jgi:3,5-epimerase/4-reductase